MNVLVTGGAGYIGSHTCKELARCGHVPVAFDNLSRGNHWAVRWGPLVQGCISNEELLTKTIRTYDIEAIMHFAAFAYVGESMNHPHMYFQNNSVNSLKLIQSAKQCGVRYFVFSSTCATYGDPQELPITEDQTQAPVNPYGESKLIVEKILRWYGELHGLKSVTLRYFNASGADEDNEIGECHDPETHLIPLVLEAAINPDRPVRLFGQDFPTSDGTAVRDYIHVSDLATAHVEALRYLTAGGESKAFNLGTGRGCSVAEIIRSVENVTGRRVALVECPRRVGDPPELIAATDLAATELGWRARRLDINEIIATSWRWHQSPFMLDIRPRAASA